MPVTNWLTPAEQNAWRSYIDATTRVHNACSAALQAEANLTLEDYSILVALSEAPEVGIRMSELADAVAMSRSGLTYRFDRLAKMGYVCRNACPTDGRSSYGVLTKDGKAGLEAAAPTHVANVRTYLIDHMSSDGFATLGAALEPIGKALRPGGAG